MKRFALALLLALTAFPALAEELRITLNITGGQEPIRFTLSEENTRQFWQKWRSLPLTDSIVPIPNDNSSYKGLNIYPAEGGADVRVFKGVVSRDSRTRKDEYRQLERWLLTFAPPPMGPALVRALDEDVAIQPGAAAQTRALAYVSGEQVVATCFQRASQDARRRALCIHEQLLQRLPAADYAKALGGIALQALPPKLDTTTR